MADGVAARGAVWEGDWEEEVATGSAGVLDASIGREVSVSASSVAEGDGSVALEVVCAVDDDAIFSDVDGPCVISDEPADVSVPDSGKLLVTAPSVSIVDVNGTVDACGPDELCSDDDEATVFEDTP